MMKSVEKPTVWRVFDSFYPRARELRAVFDDRFADPLRSDPLRFQWDYWHVPGEYTLLRTPAYAYFPPSVYERFHRFLVRWGRERLGCHDISPPWLSCYIDGCGQAEHRDVPHGPLAFVFSLTDWRRRAFRGGETFIRSPRARIEPLFNRLTIFNPALAHGVREVRGTRDPRRGRLVVHGWFVNPRPFWTGGLRAEDVRQAVEGDLQRALPTDLYLGDGMIAWRLQVGRDGRVRRQTSLVNTLLRGRAGDVERFRQAVESLRFPARRRPSVLTLPFTSG